MNMAQVILEQITASEPLVQRLGWSLVHFVWQGAAVAALLTVTLFLVKAKRPTTRYAISLFALLVMVACPIATFCLIEPATPQRVAQTDATVDSDAGSAIKPSQTTERPNLLDAVATTAAVPGLEANPPAAETSPSFAIPDEDLAATDSHERTPVPNCCSD